jgi:hypothetical protein
VRSTTASSRPRSDGPEPPEPSPPGDLPVPPGSQAPTPAPALDPRVGAAELERLAARLVPPCSVGPYTLTGRVARTSNALVFTATGGVCGETGAESGGGVLKLTGSHFAPLLTRELRLLVRCGGAGVEGVVRPLSPEPVRLRDEAVAIALPFLSGGDLAEVARGYATRNGRLGPGLALQAGRRVLAVQRALLALDRPIVHGDVKLQNVLLPAPDAPLTALTLIDLDAARELDLPLARLAEAPPATGEWLAEDVRAFGDLLAQLATGVGPGAGGDAGDGALRSGNPAFDTLVARCRRSYPGDGAGYVCLADEGLRFDLQRALDVQEGRAGHRSSWSALRGRLGPLPRWLPRLPWGRDRRRDRGRDA